jgi:hypothetical protein
MPKPIEVRPQAGSATAENRRGSESDPSGRLSVSKQGWQSRIGTCRLLPEGNLLDGLSAVVVGANHWEQVFDGDLDTWGTNWDQRLGKGDPEGRHFRCRPRSYPSPTR